MYCINLHLTVYQFTFNADCICNLFYISEKNVVQQVVFRYKFYGFVDVFTYSKNPSEVY